MNEATKSALSRIQTTGEALRCKLLAWLTPEQVDEVWPLVRERVAAERLMILAALEEHADSLRRASGEGGS